MADPDKLQQWGGASQQSALGSPGLGLGIGGGAFSGTSSIFLGTTGKRINPQQPPTARTVTADQARGEPIRWMREDPETLKKFVNTGILNKIPGFDVGMGLPEVMAAWDDLVKSSWAVNAYLPDGSKMTPWDIMNSYSNQANKFGSVRRGDWLYDIATGEKLKYVGPKTKVSTQKKVDLSSPEDVRAIATNALSELLGRAPTPEELAQFRSSVNAFEESNPMVAVTTETLDDMGEVVNTSTQQSGGVSAEARALLVSDAAKKGPEYAKFQSGTTYWNALVQMMGG